MRIFLAVVCLCFAATALFAGEAPPPIGIPNVSLGGAALNEYTPGVYDGKGPHNIGLLVKCWGKVTAIDPAATPTYFYISDGSAVFDGSGNQGIRVAVDKLAAGNSIAIPTVGQFLVITGISSTAQITVGSESRIIPLLRPRNQPDIIPVS